MVREHVYDKCWSLDVTWAEVENLIAAGRVVERQEQTASRLKEIRLLDWSRPLHGYT